MESINHQADFTDEATWFAGFASYGQILVGDQGFEFFTNGDARKCIQIPWSEVNTVTANVLFNGKWIPRIGIQTKKDGTFLFASRHPRKLLHHINTYIPADRMFRARSVFDSLKLIMKNKTGKAPENKKDALE